MKTTTLPLGNLMNRLPLPAFLLFPFVLACFVLLPQVRAVSPPPDGCYNNFTTAEGCDALSAVTNGSGNTALGWRSLFSDSIGSFNTGVGGGALALNNADSNTAVGAAALLLNTTGTENTVVGTDALVFNDSGSFNTANGAFALSSHTTGDDNTAVGDHALFSDTDGDHNTAVGSHAIFFGGGLGNTANGYQALYSGGGFSNTAVGEAALYGNTDGFNNTAVGESALSSNGAGLNNTANGVDALQFNTTGTGNTALGLGALQSNSTGSSNIALGLNAGASLTTGNNNIDIGNIGVAAEANTIRIGDPAVQTATFIAGVSGAMVTGSRVVVNSSGQVGVAPSSQRFKDEIKPIDKASEAILALNPVTFRYKKDLDPDRVPQFGLVAEEVEKVNPDLVARDEQGKPYTVRYEAVNAMLLNEFLKEHAKVEQLTKEFESKLAEQQKQIQQLTAGLQKVSAQLELRKPALRTVLNDQ
jgi:Chaperone of endosialidase